MKDRISIGAVCGMKNTIVYEVDVFEDGHFTYVSDEYDDYKQALREARKLGREKKLEVWSYTGVIYRPSGQVDRPNN